MPVSPVIPFRTSLSKRAEYGCEDGEDSTVKSSKIAKTFLALHDPTPLKSFRRSYEDLEDVDGGDCWYSHW
jgi:hypothetical protein